MSVILGLDIGTENVKAIIAKLGKKGDLTVLSCGKAAERPGSMHAGAITDIPAVVASCEEAILAAETAAREHATTVIVGIAGELVKGNTTTVHYTREDPNTPITEQEMNEIVTKVQQKSGLVASKAIALETGSSTAEVRLINSAIVNLTIDGYKIMTPIGFKGAEVNILIYTAFAPLLHVAAIEKVCAELNLDLLTIAVEPFAICRACLGDDLESSYSAIIMDVGGATTDLAVIDEGSIEGTKFLPIGGRNLAKSPEDALPVWFTGVEVALEEFGPDLTLPRNVYLCGGGADNYDLEEQLAIGDWYSTLPFPRRPVINILNVHNFPGIKIPDSVELDHTFATALGLIRVGADTLAGSPEENKLKSRLTKLLQN